MSIPLMYVIQINYPTAIVGLNGNVTLVNHGLGAGDEIGAWNVPNVTQPTADQLAAYQTDANTIAKWQFIQNGWSNAPLIVQLDAIDAKSIRAIRTNDTVRMASLESEAAALRAQLLPTA